MNVVAAELAIISTNELQLSSKLEFVSASSSDIGATDMQDKLAGSDKKVHWNCKYVQLLLDCVESRIHEFKNKSIHKKVWDDIGKEMQIYGFSTEHCYNKWKNLRRDVRMFAINPNKSTKNQETLNRVKKLISTICPNFDPTAVYKKSTKSPNKHSEESSNSLEPLTKLLTPPTSPFSDVMTPINNENMEIQDGELMPAGGGGGGDSNMADMKFSATSDVFSYILKQQQPHNPATLLFHPNITPNLFLNGDKDVVVATYKDATAAAAAKPPLMSSNAQCLQKRAADHPPCNKKSMVHRDELLADSKNSSSNYSTWPYELYDLLVSFRTEEVKQAHSIEQLIRQINEIRDSSVRRMNTIQQLMNLANLLINSKVS